MLVRAYGDIEGDKNLWNITKNNINVDDLNIFLGDIYCSYREKESLEIIGEIFQIFGIQVKNFFGDDTEYKEIKLVYKQFKEHHKQFFRITKPSILIHSERILQKKIPKMYSENNVVFIFGNKELGFLCEDLPKWTIPEYNLFLTYLERCVYAYQYDGIIYTHYYKNFIKGSNRIIVTGHCRTVGKFLDASGCLVFSLDYTALSNYCEEAHISLFQVNNLLTIKNREFKFHSYLRYDEILKVFPIIKKIEDPYIDFPTLFRLNEKILG